jgi:hypothetical protein
MSVSSLRSVCVYTLNSVCFGMHLYSIHVSVFTSGVQQLGICMSFTVHGMIHDHCGTVPCCTVSS